ncbi:MAG: GNAT family N-acetyltransferase [Thermoplasmata archaeon]|uniref:GNAT family N-acetyltransferase n=1 Tax=Candidatus Sysuiplasma superficiale TaxID=2823368 RepID=A0A8J7YN20_9ARCH|nr:GNAT family N-acetyltransferase [Candidatus Sysuiplasma superficiale]MBX8643783.1 GNAT family N-acetyltransferase [Candidatus Sysuiplasma superficiale]MCL4346607.1 GNAT family N-acetyltransferase [Candidatus Thermoplasmatota archaeon]
MSLKFRKLDSSDIDFALKVTETEKWYLSEEDISFYLDNRGATGIVALESSRPVGFATSVIYQHTAWIGNVIVAPEARNRGVGKQLVSELMEMLRREGIGNYHLYAYDRSRTLYERLGFRFDAAIWEIAILGGRRKSDEADMSLYRGYTDGVDKFDRTYFRESREHVLKFASSRRNSTLVYHRDSDGMVDGYYIENYVDESYGSEVAPFISRKDALETLLSEVMGRAGILHLYVPQQNIGKVEDFAIPFQLVRRIHRGFLGRNEYLPELNGDVISAGFLETG